MKIKGKMSKNLLFIEVLNRLGLEGQTQMTLLKNTRTTNITIELCLLLSPIVYINYNCVVGEEGSAAYA